MTFNDFLVSSNFRRMDSIVRWQGMDTIVKETLSSHHHMVGVLTTLLVEELGFSLENKLLALQYAPFHDYEEVATGDLTHNFKHNEFNGKELRLLTDAYIKNHFEKEFDSDSPIGCLLKRLVVDKIKDNPVVKDIVKIADWLSMCIFLTREYDMGNKTVEYTLFYCRKQLSRAALDFCNAHKDYNLAPLLEIKNQYNNGTNH